MGFVIKFQLILYLNLWPECIVSSTSFIYLLTSLEGSLLFVIADVIHVGTEKPDRNKTTRMQSIDDVTSSFPFLYTAITERPYPRESTQRILTTSSPSCDLKRQTTRLTKENQVFTFDTHAEFLAVSSTKVLNIDA